jgi:hypothetical protein
MKKNLLFSSICFVFAVLLCGVTFAQNNGNNTTAMCVNGNTVYVNQNAVQGMLNGGAVLGDCEGCVDPDLINFQIFCLSIYDPVCGCDGVTYPNACIATYSFGITGFFPGECNGCTVTPPDDPGFCPLFVDPVCGCNGVTYSNSCFAASAGVSSWTDGACDGGDVVIKSDLADKKAASASAFELYPNPANANVSVAFVSPETGTATVSLYDLSGKRVATLFNAVAEANQAYKMTFDIQELDAGIYFLSLELSNGTLTTEKLVITK